MRKQRFILVLVTALLSASSSIRAHDDDQPEGKPGEQLGAVHFETSCSPAVQAQFDRGMALFHNFWFDPAAKAFSEVTQRDPACAMAWWGVALSRMTNPFAWPPSAKALAAGWEAIQKAQAAGAKTEREREYIEAVALLYRDAERTDHRTRALAFEKAMEAIAQRYPQDIEATVLYALALNATALPSDKTYSQQLRAAAMLEQVWKEHPQHPGAAHYIIHSYDYPPIAQRGLEAARRYAAIAPAAPHALHMPAHIFTRLGYWDESIQTNQRSAAAARSELQQAELSAGSYNALHAMDYMAYGYLQLGQDAEARALLSEVQAIQKIDVENFVAAYAFAAIPARWALERGDWQAAAELSLQPASLSWQKFPQAEAINVFARALGAARVGDTGAAVRSIERLKQLQAALESNKQPYWAEQVAIQELAAAAWLSYAQGDAATALSTLRKAAEREDATEKHPVTPGPLVPVRELLGEMLLDMGRPAEALVEFERSIAREPNRYRGFNGAGRAAELAGEQGKARDYYSRLLRLAKPAASERPETSRARSFLSASN